MNEQVQTDSIEHSAPPGGNAPGEGAAFVPGVTDTMDHPFGMEADAAPTRKLNQGVVLLVIVLVVAGGALYAMRKGGSASIDTSINDVELKIEAALAQVGLVHANGDDPQAAIVALAANTDLVIARFTADPSAQQVPIDQVQKNPFVMAGAARADEPRSNLVESTSLEDRQRERRLAELRTELSGLQLQTVMNGRSPMAVISGRVVRERDTIGSFVVVTIEPRTVSLTAEGNSYQLTMEEPDVKHN